MSKNEWSTQADNSTLEGTTSAVARYNGVLPSGDVRDQTLVVSSYALVRVQVKDYLFLANNSGRPDVCLDMNGNAAAMWLASAGRTGSLSAASLRPRLSGSTAARV